MTLLLTVALGTSIVLSLALVAAWRLRRQSAATRHWILATGIFCAGAMPVVEATMPAWPVPLPRWLEPAATSTLALTSTPVPDGPPAIAKAAEVLPALSSSPYPRATLILIVWLSGAGIGIAALLAGLIRLARLGRGAHGVTRGALAAAAADAARAQGVLRPIRLLQGRDSAPVVTWGLMRPRVLLPASAAEWTDERLRVVLSHELAHVRRGDWGLQIAASLVQCLYWFNPLVWVACRQLRLESERACDDAVLTSGVGGADYAAHLLAIARDTVRGRQTWMPASAIAHPSTLEGRIRAMLNPGLDRQPLSHPSRCITIVGLGALTAVLAAANVSATRTPVPLTDVVLTEPAVQRVRIEETRPSRADASPTPVVVETRKTANNGAAQNGPAVVTGTIYDQLGGYLPGVSLRLTNTATTTELTGTTDRNGQFEFRNLPAGTYELVTRLPGFAVVTNQIILAAGAAVARRITLPIGSLQEAVNVNCSAGPRDSTPPSVSREGRGGSPPAGGRGSVPFSGGMGGQISVPKQIARVSPGCPSTLLLTTDTDVVFVGRIGIDGYISDLRPLDTPSDRVVNRVVQRDVEVFDNLGRRRVVPQRTFTTVTAPEPEFVEAARIAVSQWRYTPALLNGVPVEVDVRIVVRYGRQ